MLQKKLPPVRNKDYKTKKKKKRKDLTGNGDTKTEESKQESRIKAYDYRSWDKFDVVSNASIWNLLKSTEVY